MATPDEVIRTLSVDGLSYSYRLLPRAAARTEPVLVLGGALQGMYGWPQMEDHVHPVAGLVTADLPGMGTADPLRPEQDSALMCTAIEQIIDDLGVPRVNLFGYSYGAAVAFGCARRHPERVARLLLGGVPAGITDAQLAYWRRAADRLEAGRPAEFAAMATAAMLCTDESRPVHRRHLAERYVRRTLLYAATRTPHAMNVLDRALNKKLSLDGGLTGVPSLVFCGEHDTVSPPARQRAFAATIEDSVFLTVPETDHWAVLERAEEVAALTARFFTDLPVRPFTATPLCVPPQAATPRPLARRGAGGTGP
jgi:pimeloyl-ACP methyl ester carboxylesterase